MRVSIDRCRSAFIAILLATLTAVGAGFFTAPAYADPVRNEQWQLDALNADDAWQYSTGRGVTVAILDSGVDARHPDLAGQVLPGIDLVDGTGDGRTDPVGHGTTVAALIAGKRDDDGVVGLAPGAKILPVRVLDKQNRYEDASVVARGLRWAVDNGATVINLSLGGVTESGVLSSALAYAAARDVVVIACTGNIAQTTGTDLRVWYPAREPGVVAVTGLRNASGQSWLDRPSGADHLWQGSLTGPETVLSAPAATLVGARPGGYWRVQGTSFAAPLVTATAALIRSRMPGLDAPNVINRLISTAADLGDPGRDDRYGFGLVNPSAALTGSVPVVAENPLTDVRPLSQPATGNRPRSGTDTPDNDAEPAGAGNPETLPSTPDRAPGAADTPQHLDPLDAAALLTVPVVILALLAAAAWADRHGLLTRYRRSPKHSHDNHPT